MADKRKKAKKKHTKGKAPIKRKFRKYKKEEEEEEEEEFTLKHRNDGNYKDIVIKRFKTRSALDIEWYNAYRSRLTGQGSNRRRMESLQEISLKVLGENYLDESVLGAIYDRGAQLIGRILDTVKSTVEDQVWKVVQGRRGRTNGVFDAAIPFDLWLSSVVSAATFMPEQHRVYRGLCLNDYAELSSITEANKMLVEGSEEHILLCSGDHESQLSLPIAPTIVSILDLSKFGHAFMDNDIHKLRVLAAHVVALDLSLTAVSDQGLRYLAMAHRASGGEAYGRLAVLILRQLGNVTSKGLQILSQFKGLKVIDARGTRIELDVSVAGFRHLGRKKLRRKADADRSLLEERIFALSLSLEERYRTFREWEARGQIIGADRASEHAGGADASISAGTAEHPDTKKITNPFCVVLESKPAHYPVRISGAQKPIGTLSGTFRYGLGNVSSTDGVDARKLEEFAGRYAETTLTKDNIAGTNDEQRRTFELLMRERPSAEMPPTQEHAKETALGNTLRSLLFVRADASETLEPVAESIGVPTTPQGLSDNASVKLKRRHSSPIVQELSSPLHMAGRNAWPSPAPTKKPVNNTLMFSNTTDGQRRIMAKLSNKEKTVKIETGPLVNPFKKPKA